MSFFSNILEKLGLKHPAQPAALPTAPPAAPPLHNPAVTHHAPEMDQKPTEFMSYPPTQAPSVHAGTSAPAAPAAIPMVDVVAKLERLAAANPAKLDWKVSIVDLLKLLGLDSSYAVRKELAIELGCPAEKMNDSAQMNTWLHQTVLKKIAENGGNIPKELLNK